jgi:transcriptional regulator with XRE-family HTH domain
MAWRMCILHVVANRSPKRLEPWVGPWLRARRLAAQTPRADIAKRIQRDMSALSRIESSQSVISADDLPIVLEAYGVTPAQYAAEARRALNSR